MTYDNSRFAESPRPATGADVPGRDPLPLLGRTALVTGASRRRGIGYAVARRLAAYGAGVYLHHHVPHDAGQPWGADPGGPDAVADGVREVAVPGAVVAHGPADLARPDDPARLIAWLATDEAAWITGQVINSEGGFRR
nr:hypothetical protein [Streptomyces lydicus]